MHKVFVYGTLRKGEDNHLLLETANLIAEQCWIDGEMHDTGYGYPSVKENPNSKVYGELYEVTSEQLVLLDELEDYQESSTDNLYERKLKAIHTDNGNKEGYVYFAGNQLLGTDTIISYGDWKVYKHLNNKDCYYYFAYGSCMDHERFRTAGVDQFFTNIAGRGVLSGYSLKFSLSTNDGGKADMVEDRGGKVEGIVYKVPKDAVDYLFIR